MLCLVWREYRDGTLALELLVFVKGERETDIARLERIHLLEMGLFSAALFLGMQSTSGCTGLRCNGVGTFWV